MNTVLRNVATAAIFTLLSYSAVAQDFPTGSAGTIGDFFDSASGLASNFFINVLVMGSIGAGIALVAYSLIAFQGANSGQGSGSKKTKTWAITGVLVGAIMVNLPMWVQQTAITMGINDATGNFSDFQAAERSISTINDNNGVLNGAAKFLGDSLGPITVFFGALGIVSGVYLFFRALVDMLSLSNEQQMMRGQRNPTIFSILVTFAISGFLINIFSSISMINETFSLSGVSWDDASAIGTKAVDDLRSYNAAISDTDLDKAIIAMFQLIDRLMLPLGLFFVLKGFWEIYKANVASTSQRTTAMSAAIGILVGASLTDLTGTTCMVLNSFTTDPVLICRN